MKTHRILLAVFLLLPVTRLSAQTSPASPITNRHQGVSAIPLGQSSRGTLAITISGSCPGVMTLDVSGATPFAAVAVAVSPTTGSASIPSGPCAGTTLGLGAPRLITVLGADANGLISLSGNVPARGCGLYVQVVDLAACATSNVVQLGATSFPFPSASSSVIASVGFLDGEQIGYFWSGSRGDSVIETFTGAAAISGYGLDVDLPTNVLNGTNTVAWDLSINGVVVDSFLSNVGDTAIHRSGSFAPLSGPSYTVELRVTNDVPSGGGSVTLRYAGIGTHSLTLH